MRYLTFDQEEQSSYSICFLVPQLRRGDMERFYVEPHFKGQESQLLAYDLYKEEKRTKVATQREYLGELLPILKDLGVRYLVVTDAEYFKTMTKAASAEKALGYVMPCAVHGFEDDFQIVYCPSFTSVFYDPDKVKAEIRIALTAVKDHLAGSYITPGIDIIKFAAYPSTVSSIKDWLQRLLDMDVDLTADIEAFSLKHYDAGIGTISFAWSKHEGIAFPVDLHEDAATIRVLLTEFFRLFRRKITWHNISYDAYVLVYQLFMKDLLDTEGLLDGLGVMLRNWDCTKLITYLATNSCAGNQLGLKHQAQEFAGNYAVEEIKDIRKIPLDELLQYNLVDSLSTWFVYEKHWDTLVADDQLEIYETLFKPAIWDIIQMQLTGLPVNMEEVHKVHAELVRETDAARAAIEANILVQEYVYWRNCQWVEEKNATLKKKRVTLADAKEVFNPGSGPQLQTLLFDEKFLALPILETTDTGLPSTGGETLAKLKNHTKDPRVIELLDALIELKTAGKFLTDFIPSFLAAPRGPDEHHYLFGYFNLGGTVSGRLSSSNPNLQNLPSNGNPLLPNKIKYAKLIKRCVQAPEGWLFVGLDFASLEDRISALTTKDPNKLKVYTDGYDGHCLRAYSYFSEQMPDIDPSQVESINSIESKYKALRQQSKNPTFALTYQGTYHTLMTNSGFTEALARQIETRYHELYRVSDEWVAAKIQEAGQKGYLTVAFGLRVRTPLLKQVILGTSKTPYEAEAEGRTAGNALGQSWCLLNSRAAVEFNQKVRSSKYRLDIRPCAHIHDAQYHLIRDNLATLLFYNEHLVKAVQWQDHPDIYHDEVKLGGEVSIFYPSWATEMVVPNGASAEKIKELAAEHHAKYC